MTSLGASCSLTDATLKLWILGIKQDVDPTFYVVLTTLQTCDVDSISQQLLVSIKIGNNFVMSHNFTFVSRHDFRDVAHWFGAIPMLYNEPAQYPTEQDVDSIKTGCRFDGFDFSTSLSYNSDLNTRQDADSTFLCRSYNSDQDLNTGPYSGLAWVPDFDTGLFRLASLDTVSYSGYSNPAFHTIYSVDLIIAFLTISNSTGWRHLTKCGSEYWLYKSCFSYNIQSGWRHLVQTHSGDLNSIQQTATFSGRTWLVEKQVL